MPDRANGPTDDLRLLRRSAAAIRDHDVALQLYAQVQRIEGAHPSIANLVQQAAELLLQVNEHRCEGIRLALAIAGPPLS